MALGVDSGVSSTYHNGRRKYPHDGRAMERLRCGHNLDGEWLAGRLEYGRPHGLWEARHCHFLTSGIVSSVSDLCLEPLRCVPALVKRCFEGLERLHLCHIAFISRCVHCCNNVSNIGTRSGRQHRRYRRLHMFRSLTAVQVLIWLAYHVRRKISTSRHRLLRPYKPSWRPTRRKRGRR